MCSDTKQRTARVAAITVVTFVILATIGAGLTPAILNSDSDADQAVESTAQANTVQDEDEGFPHRQTTLQIPSSITIRSISTSH